MRFALTRLSQRYIALLAALSAVVMVFLYREFIYLPQRARIAGLETALENEKKRVEVVENFVTASGNLDTQARDLASRARYVNRLLPDNAGVNEFMTDISRDARESGVQIAEMVHGQPVNKEGYQEIAIELKIAAKFSSTLKFLRWIENSPRFAAIRSVVIQPRTDNPEILETKMSVALYRFGNSPVPASQAAGTSGGALPRGAPAPGAQVPGVAPGGSGSSSITGGQSAVEPR